MRMWIRLALTMGTTPKRLMQEMDSEEFALLMAYDSVEPIGDAKLDLLAGTLASNNASVQLGKKSNGQSFTPSDFMHRYWQEVDRQQVADKVRISLDRIARQFGGKQ